MCKSLVFKGRRNAARSARFFAVVLAGVTSLGATLHPIFCVAAHCHPPETHHVRRVLDGDSLVLDDGRSVRLIGVNAPEYGKDGLANQPLAREARRFLAKLVQGQCIRLVFEAESRDRYGRVLAHALLSDGASVEESLIRQGFAWMVAISPNVAWTERLAASEAQARALRRGVWNIPDYRPVAVTALGQLQSGFRMVEGTVRHVDQDQNAYYFELSPHISLSISHADWNRYFHGDPVRFLNRRVVVRGWLSPHRDRLRMRVHHPAMLTFVG